MELRREFSGRELQLRYTFNSLCAMEDRSGTGLEELMNKKYGSVRLLFWGALIERQPELTLAQAGDIIGDHIAAGGSLEDVAALCLEALERAGFGGEK